MLRPDHVSAGALALLALLLTGPCPGSAAQLTHVAASAIHKSSAAAGDGARTTLDPGATPARHTTAPLSAFVERFIELVPKAELHVHVEGTLEPAMMLDIAARNGLPPPYPSVEAAEAAYQFEDLQAFLDMYYFGCSVLQTSQDFYDLAWAYFEKAVAGLVVHAEVFFDPQTHLSNGVPFDVFMPGLIAAAENASSQLGLAVSYIMCFRKDLSAQSAMEVLALAAPWQKHIVGIGLDSTEIGNPPSKFASVYEHATAQGYLPVAHAGEEGGPEYVWDTIKVLKVRRIDHGVHSLDDPSLMNYLKATQLPLTVCPLSNLKLKVYAGQVEEKLTELVASGVVVTVNSDDAAYFKAYIVENYKYLAAVAKLGIFEVARLAKNSFAASFYLGEGRRAELQASVDALAAAALSSERDMAVAALVGERGERAVVEELIAEA